MPNASIFERVARATVSSEPAGWKTPRQPHRIGVLRAERHDVFDLEVDRVADAHRVVEPVLTYLDGRALEAQVLPDERAKRLHRTAERAEKTPPSFSACSSDASASMNMPRRQLPSLMTLGVSATAATVRPPTSTPSTSPASMRKTRVTRQRSCVAPSANDAVHGQTTLQEQVSK